MKKILKIFLMTYAMFTACAVADSYKWSKGNSNISFVDKASVEIKRVVKSRGSSFEKNIYKNLFYSPIWVEQKGLSRMGVELMDVVRNDRTLSSSMKSSKLVQQSRKAISNLAARGGNGMNEKIALEMTMSKLYQAYAGYIITGGIDWDNFKDKLANLKESKKIDAQWVVYNPKSTPASVLRASMTGKGLAREFQRTEPQRFHYSELKNYLIKYIDIRNSGEWMNVGKYHGKINVGDSTLIIPAIRNNLKLLGDLNGCMEPADPNEYDGCLSKGIKRFQLRNGAKATGVIDKNTYGMVKRSLSNRIKYIRLNIDKIKRFRRRSRDIRMELNIPSFRLNFLDKNELVDTIRVVVGKPEHPTPVFGNTVQYIVVNPWWKIPESIVKNEMLDHLIKDPYYYERKGKVLHKTWDTDSERIDPGTVKWSKYKGNKKYIPYRFMQVPSSKNALGKIKFMFPNNFSVYIHDTPSKSLFFKTYRAYSHGCMRIQKPRELLKAFAMYNKNINVDEIMDQLKTTKNSTIPLEKHVPIDITYLTAFVDVYGNMNFRKDVYGYDKMMLKNYSNSTIRAHSVKSVKKKEKKKEKKTEKKSSKKSPEKNTKKKSKSKAHKVHKNAVAKTESQLRAESAKKKRKIKRAKQAKAKTEAEIESGIKKIDSMPKPKVDKSELKTSELYGQ